MTWYSEVRGKLRVELASHRAAPRVRRPGNTAHCCIRQHPVLPPPLHLAHCLQTLGSHKQWLRPPAPVLISSHLISPDIPLICRKNYEATHLRFSTIFRQCPKFEIVTILLMTLLSGFVFVFTRDWVPGSSYCNAREWSTTYSQYSMERYPYLFCWIKNTIKHVRCL